MIIAVNITLDIGLLMDEFRRFASETHKLMRETAQGWAGGLASAGQEMVSRRLGRTSLAKPVGSRSGHAAPPEPAGTPGSLWGASPQGCPAILGTPRGCVPGVG